VTRIKSALASKLAQYFIVAGGLFTVLAYGWAYYFPSPEVPRTSRIASPVVTPPPTGTSDITLELSVAPGCQSTFAANDTFEPPPGCSTIAYTINIRKNPGPDIVSLSVSDCIADNPVDFGGASDTIDPLPPPPGPAVPACDPFPGEPTPRGVTWNINLGENTHLLDRLNATGATQVNFFVTTRAKDACFVNAVYGGATTLDSEVAVVAVPNSVQLCIAHPSYPYLTSTKASVHAGGGIGEGSGCGSGGNVIGRTLGGAGSRGEVAVSAHSTIASFYSGTLPSTTDISLGNSPGLGQYGSYCRADLVKAANRHAGPRAAFGGSLIAANGTLLEAPAHTSLGPQSVSSRLTLLVNGDLFINGNIILSGGSFSRASMPALGVIATGSIYIAPGVTRLDGYYYAANSINTCFGPRIEASEASACSSHLTVNGLMTAQTFKFRRTGPVGVAGLRESERFNFSGALLVKAPPVFNDLITEAATRQSYDGERPPLR
jgi:hypothetical protein